MSGREIEDLVRRLARLREYIGQASEYSDIGLEAYRESDTIQDAVERRLQLCTEAAIDIGRTILRVLGARPATDYADVFRALSDEGVLPTHLARSMQQVARYRNRLVHDYDDLDPAARLRVSSKTPAGLCRLRRYRGGLGNAHACG